MIKDMISDKNSSEFNSFERDVRPLNPPEALTFDDVLMVPQYSDIMSRRHVDITSWLTPDIPLTLPAISANMDSVTESEMAKKMALGTALDGAGMGFIHRFNSIEKEVEEVEKVKRFRSYIIEDPYTILATDTIAKAEDLMDEKEIGGLLVVDKKSNVLTGIVTRRDIYSENKDKLVSQVLTSREDMVIAAYQEMKDPTKIKKAKEMMHEAKVEKLPLIDDKDRPVGLIVMKDIRKLEDYPKASVNAKGNLLVGAAIGTVGDYMDRASALIQAGCDVLVSDVAHAHHKSVSDSIKKLKSEFDVPVVAGTIATAEGFRYLAESGADSVAVGVGSGSICSTRLVAGHGMPQLHALYECYRVQQESFPQISIIADGGIRKPADFDKAMVFADLVKMGSMLAGTPESPGEVTRDENGAPVKIYRGMASQEAFESKLENEGVTDRMQRSANYTPEGIQVTIPTKPPVEQLLSKFAGGLRSAMSYTGARDLKEYKKKAKFVRVTNPGLSESDTHIRDQK